MLKIADMTKFTLQDFPNRIACVLWFAGCNMRCKYCHNADLLEQNKHFLQKNDVIEFLKSKIGLLEGVVLSGGECTLQGEELINFMKEIKELGFEIKIDTNGLNYNFIKSVIDMKLVDFIALDYKSIKEKFDYITNTTNQYDMFAKTLSLIVNSNIEKEIRTTVHTTLLEEGDINNIIKNLENIGYKGNYYIQNYRNDNKTVKNLENQIKILDKNKITKSNKINILCRNFF